MLAPSDLPASAEDVDDTAFRDFIRLHVARQDAAPATVESYLRETRFFRRWLAAQSLPLRSLTPRDVREWVAAMVANGYAPTTIATKLAAVRRLLDAGVQAGLFVVNPAHDVRGPRDKRLTGAAAQRTLAVPEVKRLLYAAGAGPTSVRDRALVALLVGHGLRTVELARINLGDIDLADKTLLAHGKTADRLVYLRTDVTERLRTLLEARASGGARATDPLFVSEARSERAGARGSRLSRRGVRFIVDRLYAASGLVDAAYSRRGRPLRRAARGAKSAARRTGQRVPTTHGLRATNVTLAIAGGAELEHVAADVGHADIRTTMRYVELQRRRENNSALHVPVEF